MNIKLVTYRAAAVTLLLIISAIVGSFGLAILQGLGTLVSVAVVGVVLAVLFKAQAYLGLVVENRIMKLIKAEAWRNPIETRETIAAREQQAIIEAREKEVKWLGGINTWERQIAKHREEFPDDQSIKRSEAALEKMRVFHHSLVQAIAKSEADLASYIKETRMLDSSLKIALGIADLGKAMNKKAVDEAFNNALSEIASESVESSFNNSMALLDQLVRQADIPVPATPTPVLIGRN